MKRSLFFIFLIVPLFLEAQPWKAFRFESGDLLFQDLDCGEICDALRGSSAPLDGKHYTHVGMAYRVKDSLWVIEAYGQGVQIVPLNRFMERSITGNGKTRVSVGRVPAEFQSLAGRAVGFALEQRGIPYDHEYTYDNGRYYSSELVFDAYKAAHYGKALFDAGSMSFRDPSGSRITTRWEKYFEEIGVQPPEGKSSISPAGLAADENIEIVRSFY